MAPAAAGGQSAALEAVDASQELGGREGRLDDLLSASVERPALSGVEDPLDPLGLVASARTALSCAEFQ